MAWKENAYISVGRLSRVSTFMRDEDGEQGGGGNCRGIQMLTDGLWRNTDLRKIMKSGMDVFLPIYVFYTHKYLPCH